MPGGLTLGLLTAYVLASNGILLGAVAGLATGAGNGGDLLRLIVGHGVLELSCIAVAAAAGLRVGWSIVEPGPGTRAEALRAEAGAVGRDRARDDAVARAGGAGRGLRHGQLLARGRAAGGDRAGRALLGSRAHARPRAFARAYALTQAPAKRSGRASTTVAPAAPTRRAASARALRISSATVIA